MSFLSGFMSLTISLQIKCGVVDNLEIPGTATCSIDCLSCRYKFCGIMTKNMLKESWPQQPKNCTQGYGTKIYMYAMMGSLKWICRVTEMKPALWTNGDFSDYPPPPPPWQNLEKCLLTWTKPRPWSHENKKWVYRSDKVQGVCTSRTTDNEEL